MLLLSVCVCVDIFFAVSSENNKKAFVVAGVCVFSKSKNNTDVSKRRRKFLVLKREVSKSHVSLGFLF